VRWFVQYRAGVRVPETFIAHLPAFQCLIQAGDSLQGVTLHVQARNYADLLRHWFDIDTGHLGAGEQQPALGRVVAEFCTDPENEVGVSQQSFRRLGREGAGNADIPWMTGEIALALQRCRQQRTDTIRQANDLVLGLRGNGTLAGDDHRPLRGRQFLDHRCQQIRTGVFHPRRQEQRRRPILEIPVEVLVL